MKAFLILEDGTLFEGIHRREKEIISEIRIQQVDGWIIGSADGSVLCRTGCLHDVSLDRNYGICKDEMDSAGPADGFMSGN